MVLNFQVESKEGKSTSRLIKNITITNGNQPISYKTINRFYKHLLNEGYESNQIYIKVLNPQRYFTIKNLQEEMYGTLEDYYVNKTKDPEKFTNTFYNVKFGIIS